ncbi:helix-turn-helix transcriptional regulator [Arenibaculum pallidiluteum]|uniref:helix-turn-helix transcriptional regulator n=1 Tax=Arenibaculum pallidiluteum TaxID=2812559 RepID=UPI001A96FF48|nr:AraC family transcriptional regulator [Arenibaculum pallidiluteum]
MPRRPVDPHRFWRDPGLPHLEAREVSNGRATCYDPHSHPTFSIGAITGGQNEFRIGGARHEVAAGAVVLMNPDEVHACNPLGDLPWSYRMLYVDPGWLAEVQERAEFQPLGPAVSTSPALHAALNRLFDVLFDATTGAPAKNDAATAFFAALDGRLAGKDEGTAGHLALSRAADFIAMNCTRPLRLEEIAEASGLSPSYLVRAFKARYGLTPHAYQTNRRIRFGQQELRRGRPIVEVALEAGFADQAHFQRVFKRHVAATPGQYAGATPT